MPTWSLHYILPVTLSLIWKAQIDEKNICTALPHDVVKMDVEEHYNSGKFQEHLAESWYLN